MATNNKKGNKRGYRNWSLKTKNTKKRGEKNDIVEVEGETEE